MSHDTALERVAQARREYDEAATRLAEASDKLQVAIRAAKWHKAKGRELAEAAGMSRQQVYKRFLQKEES